MLSAAVLVAAVLLGALWAGAQIAAAISGAGWLHVGASDAIRAVARLPSHADDPGAAWSTTQLPGPLVYWACTGVALTAALAIAAGVAWLFGGPLPGTPPRTRLGVDTRARLARRRDLRSLIVNGPEPGRLILGRSCGALVATEDHHGASARRIERRHGDRTAVAIIGPTRCGKTANAIAGILDWEGPAILSSVKSDLLGATIARRRKHGNVLVFDPTGGTGEATASWSPLRASDTISGAQRAARALADAAPQGGADNLNFFLAMARQLLWPILYIAAISGASMTDVVRWILTQDRPLDDLRRGSVFAVLDEELCHNSIPRRDAAQRALEAITAVWDLDERTRGSTYATCQTMVEPWLDPEVAAAARGCSIDLEWLLSGPNTLYLCAPTHEQQRLSTVLGGLLGDLMQQAYDLANATNKPLPSTLVVLDEAGNTPTRWLPSVASTCSGIGLLLVTIWQSKAQIDAAYGRLADSVLTNHGTKIVFAGVSDAATLDYAARLLGDEEVVSHSLSADAQGVRNLSEGTVRIPLVPSDSLRQVRPGEALLLHGTLRPAHLIARSYWRDRRLQALSGDCPI
jgi:type IV secretion system protein VirD4